MAQRARTTLSYRSGLKAGGTRGAQPTRQRLRLWNSRSSLTSSRPGIGIVRRRGRVWTRGGEGRPADSEANLQDGGTRVTADAREKPRKNLVARRRRHIGASGRATMGREDVLISSNEREFIVKALRESELRVDGRGPFDLRPVSYRFGPKGRAR